jgi:hypothetical protein
MEGKRTKKHMIKLFNFLRRVFRRPKIKRTFAIHYFTNDHDMLILGVANYEVETPELAFAMHRSDYPGTTVTHAIGYVWKEYA